MAYCIIGAQNATVDTDTAIGVDTLAHFIRELQMLSKAETS